MLTRDSFKPYALLKRERLDIPEMSDFVYVRELSAGEALETAWASFEATAYFATSSHEMSKYTWLNDGSAIAASIRPVP